MSQRARLGPCLLVGVIIGVAACGAGTTGSPATGSGAPLAASGPSAATGSGDPSTSVRSAIHPRPTVQPPLLLLGHRPPTLPLPTNSRGPAGTSAASDDGLPRIGVPGLGIALRLPVGWVGLDASFRRRSWSALRPDFPISLTTLTSCGMPSWGSSAMTRRPWADHAAPDDRGDRRRDRGPEPARRPGPQNRGTDRPHRGHRRCRACRGNAACRTGRGAPLPIKPKNGGDEMSVDDWFVSTAGRTFLLSFVAPVTPGEAWRAETRAVAESLSGT